MNVIDFATGRAIGAPAPFTQTFEIFSPELRRPRPTDIVDVIATVRHETGSAILNFANDLRARSADAWRAQSSAKVVAFPTGESLAAPSTEIPNIEFSPDPETSDSAWRIEALLTRECAQQLAASLRAKGAVELIIAVQDVG